MRGGKGKGRIWWDVSSAHTAQEVLYSMQLTLWTQKQDTDKNKNYKVLVRIRQSMYNQNCLKEKNKNKSTEYKIIEISRTKM